MTLHSLKDILKLYNVKALKNLSQNFIFDDKILRKIAAVGSPPSIDTAVIEIGPAAGNLTRALLDKGYTKLLLIEKDTRFQPILKQLEDYSQGKAQVIFGDALNISKDWLPLSWFEGSNPVSKIQIIGNLPFAVATPLTLNLIKELSLTNTGIFNNFIDAEMIFLFQKEVALKFAAKLGTKDYGRLAIISQAFCNVEYQFQIDRTKFTPSPKVDSGLVKFKIKPFDQISPFIKNDDKLFEKLETLSQKLFRHKNKKLDSIKLPWAELGINSNHRPLHLRPEDLIKILYLT